MFLYFVCVCDFHCNMFDCGVWYSLLSNCGVVQIGYVFFSCIRKNLVFCGGLMMVVVMMIVGFWWLG